MLYFLTSAIRKNRRKTKVRKRKFVALAQETIVQKHIANAFSTGEVVTLKFAHAMTARIMRVPKGSRTCSVDGQSS